MDRGNRVAFAASTQRASARYMRTIMLYCHYWLNGEGVSRIREELHGAKTGAHPALIGRFRLCYMAVAAPAAPERVVCAVARSTRILCFKCAFSDTVHWLTSPAVHVKSRCTKILERQCSSPGALG